MRAGMSGRGILLFMVLLQVVLLCVVSAPWAAVRVTAPVSWTGVYTEHFWVEHAGCSEEDVALVCESAENAYAALWAEGLIMEKGGVFPVLIRIFPDTGSLAVYFGWAEQTQAMGAYRKGQIGVLAPGFWMKGEKSAEIFDKEGPLLHELTHLLVDEMTAGHYNRWWTEGVAQYMEKKIHGCQMPIPSFVASFYTLEELETQFDRLDETQAYWQSLMAVTYIVEHYTEEALVQIMCRAAEENDFQAALADVLDTTYEVFERDYQDELRRKSGTGWRVEKQPITH